MKVKVWLKRITKAVQPILDKDIDEDEIDDILFPAITDDTDLIINWWWNYD